VLLTERLHKTSSGLVTLSAKLAHLAPAAPSTTTANERHQSRPVWPAIFRQLERANKTGNANAVKPNKTGPIDQGAKGGLIAPSACVREPTCSAPRPDNSINFDLRPKQASWPDSKPAARRGPPKRSKAASAERERARGAIRAAIL